MPLLELQKLTVGLSRTWAGFLRDWDRSLRSGNYPETIRYNYLSAAAQLGRYLGEHLPDPDADDAAGQFTHHSRRRTRTRITTGRASTGMSATVRW